MGKFLVFLYAYEKRAINDPGQSPTLSLVRWANLLTQLPCPVLGAGQP